MRSRSQIAPGEPAPDEAEAYANLEERWRAEGCLSPIATIKRCEAKWRWLVEEVESGYDDDRYEWTNDLDSRRIIQRAIDELPKDLSARLAERVRSLWWAVRHSHRIETVGWIALAGLAGAEWGWQITYPVTEGDSPSASIVAVVGGVATATLLALGSRYALTREARPPVGAAPG